jgi:hypothetical protein
MFADVEAEREQLEAVLRRHGPGMPPGAWAAIGAAADELLDPRTLPADSGRAPAGGPDPLEAVRQARARLTALAGTLPTLTESAACARAARHLADAEHDLTTGWPTTPSSGTPA